MKMDGLLHGMTNDAIALHNIDPAPGPYCMSFGFDLEPLIRSIERIGVINPPLLFRAGNQGEKLTVITGYRRILALRALEAEYVACRILSQSAISPLDCLQINLYENLAIRSLNPVEKGMVLNRLDPLVPPDGIRRHYMPLLGLPNHEETKRLYLRLDRDLDDTSKLLIAQDRLGIQGVRRLMKLDPDARAAISDLFIKLKFNVNQQIQVIDYLSDLYRIEHRTVADILNDDPIRDILSDTHANTPQKAKALLRLLRERRLPSVVEADCVFNRQVAGLPLPKGIQIAPPPYFEGPYFKMTILFKDGHELVKKINKLSTIEGLKGLSIPWKHIP